MKWRGILITIVVFFSVLPLGDVSANIDTIDTTVKLSVCGNSIIEGNEDCEGTNLNSATCGSLGYGGGVLSCDIACSFDTSGCTAPTPTPTVLPTSTPSPPSNQDESSTLPLPQPLPTPFILDQLPIIPPEGFLPTIIPPELVFFDVNNTGKIEVSTMKEVVTLWVDEWKKFINIKNVNPTIDEESIDVKCDVNRDNECNLLDFSILLAYFE